MNLIVGHNNDENVLVLIDAEVKCKKSLLFIINPVVSILIGTNLYSSFKSSNIRLAATKENFNRCNRSEQ